MILGPIFPAHLYVTGSEEYEFVETLIRPPVAHHVFSFDLHATFPIGGRIIVIFICL